MWENLSSGETSNLDKLQNDVLTISAQVEESKFRVMEILKDFE